VVCELLVENPLKVRRAHPISHVSALTIGDVNFSRKLTIPNPTVAILPTGNSVVDTTKLLHVKPN